MPTCRIRTEHALIRNTRGGLQVRWDVHARAGCLMLGMSVSHTSTIYNPERPNAHAHIYIYIYIYIYTEVRTSINHVYASWIRHIPEIIACELHFLHLNSVRVFVCNLGDVGCVSKPRRIANHSSVREPNWRANQQHGNNQKRTRFVRLFYLGPLGLTHCCVPFGCKIKFKHLPNT